MTDCAPPVCDSPGVGGAVYLHTLMATVPTAANAGFYAQIVAEKAILRRLVEAGTRIVQLGYGGGLGSGSCAGADVQVDGGALGDVGLAGRALVDDLVLVGLARRGRGDGAQGEPVGLEGGGRLGE